MLCVEKWQDGIRLRRGFFLDKFFHYKNSDMFFDQELHKKLDAREKMPQPLSKKRLEDISQNFKVAKLFQSS